MNIKFKKLPRLSIKNTKLITEIQGDFGIFTSESLLSYEV